MLRKRDLGTIPRSRTNEPGRPGTRPAPAGTAGQRHPLAAGGAGPRSRPRAASRHGLHGRHSLEALLPSGSRAQSLREVLAPPS